MEQYFFQCPYCWEKISMFLDTSIASQTYIEDCEVCCNPIEIEVEFENLELKEIHVQSID